MPVMRWDRSPKRMVSAALVISVMGRMARLARRYAYGQSQVDGHQNSQQHLQGMQRGFRRACGDGGGGGDGGAFYLDGFLPHGVGLVLVHRLAVRLDGGGLQLFPGGGEDRLPLGVGDTQGDGVGEVYLLVEAKGLVLVIHGDQDLGDGAAELGSPSPGAGRRRLRRTPPAAEPVSRRAVSRAYSKGDAPLDGQGSHGATRRVYPVPRMVWISLVGKARSILFRRYRMYTSTTLES